MLKRINEVRKMTWVVWAWCLAILAWAIASGAHAGSSCAHYASKAAQDGCAAGTGIGVVLILGLGFFGFVFLSLIWFMSRPKPPKQIIVHVDGALNREHVDSVLTEQAS